MDFPFRVRPRRSRWSSAARCPCRRSFDESPRRHPAGARRPHHLLRRRHAQRPARDPAGLVAHGAVGRGDAAPTCHGIGIFTLPEMELPFGEMEPLIEEIERVAYEVIGARQVPGHARRRALDHAAAGVGRGAQVPGTLGPADRRPRRHAGFATWARAHNHACAMRRSLRVRSADPGRDPQPLDGGSRGAAEAEDDGVLRRLDARRTRTGSTAWSRRSATDVYVSIDVDGMDPAIMPATGHPGAGRPVVGGNHRRCSRPPPSARRIVACDIVELSPIPGMVAPAFPVREADLQAPRPTASSAIPRSATGSLNSRTRRSGPLWADSCLDGACIRGILRARGARQTIFAQGSRGPATGTRRRCGHLPRRALSSSPV